MYDRATYEALRRRTGATSVEGPPELATRVLSVLRGKHDMSPRDAVAVAVVEGLL